MGYKKKEMIYLIASIIGFLLFSVSFLLMPVETDDTMQGPNAITIAAGLMFWLGLLVGIIAQISLSYSRKKWFARNRVRLPLTNQPKLGLFSFFKNTTAIVFDVLLVMSLIGLIISVILTSGTGYACYVFIASTSFGFCAHCVFNGKNYYFIENKENIKKAIEKARANASV